MDKIINRPLMGFNVRQRTENNHLCLTDIVRIYEAIRSENGWIEKQPSKFFENQSEIEYIIELLDFQGIFTKSKKLLFIEHVKNQGLIKSLKAIGQYQTKGRGDNKAVFCDPYIFIAIAQWLNPKFRAMVTIWVTDSLILNRIEAGHEYTQLCTAISNHIVPNISENAKRFIYSNFAKLINKKVFGKHGDELRQMASKVQLIEMNKIQTKLTALIEVGHVEDYLGAKDYLKLI
jgi:hypothetical protein